MKRKEFKWIDFIIVCTGIFIMGLGSAVVFEADLGTNAIGTFVDGLHYITGFSRGTMNTSVCIILMLPAYFLVKEFFGIGSFISMFAIGMSMDICKDFLDTLLFLDSIPRLLIYAIGLMITLFGSSIYIVINMGISSFDALPIILSKYSKLNFKNAKTLIDLSFVLLGWLMGGTIGAGTLISAFCSGYLLR